MENYLLYNEFGRGKNAIVYKGRRKKSVRYYAIKSVDRKLGKRKVLAEVKLLHTFDHPNIVKFYDWYETTNHVWVILEFCVGGELLELLVEDNQLPENSIRVLGGDIIAGLSYLHSKGIIHGDLKPSNVLLDGHGICKLTGMGLASSTVDSVTPSSASSRRGTPTYMSPELFDGDGVCSYASDFWALGCMLYELAAGHPPFSASHFEDLLHEILHGDIPGFPSTCSACFEDLVRGLLEKDPLKRVTWETIVAHPFWEGKDGQKLNVVSVKNIPPQPRYEEYARKRGMEVEVKQSDAERSGVWKSEVGSNGKEKKSDVTKISTILTRRMLQAAAEKDFDEDDEEENGGNGDVKHGSSMARRRKAVQHDVEVDLNFNLTEEEVDEEVSEVDEGIDEDSGHRGDDTFEYGGIDVIPENSVEKKLKSSSSSRPVTAPPGKSRDIPKVSKGDSFSNTGTHEPSIRPVSAVAGSRPSRSSGMGTKLAEGLESVLFHPSDSSVKPIVMNARIEKIASPEFQSIHLPFTAYTASQVVSFSKKNLQAFLSKVYNTVGKNASGKEKLNTLNYLEGICGDSVTSNLFVNSSLVYLLIRLMQSNKSPAVLARLCSIVGVVFRHATYIDPALQGSGIIRVLSELSNNSSQRVRRKAISSLGELLFYVATQDNMESSSSSKKKWDISTDVSGVFINALKPQTDEVIQHYSAKSIENICAHSLDFANAFAVPDTATFALYIAHHTQNENLRTTVFSALSRICSKVPSYIHTAVEKLSLKGLISMLSDASVRIKQSAINLINVLLLQAKSSKVQMTFLEEKRFLLTNLAKIVNHGTPILRGKALACLHLLSVANIRFFEIFSEMRIYSALEKVEEDKHPYTKLCLDTFVNGLFSTAISILEELANDLESAHQHKLPSSACKSLMSWKANFVVVAHIVSVPKLRALFVASSPSVLQSLSACLLYAGKVTFPSQNDFFHMLINVIEEITRNTETILQNVDAFIDTFLPAFAANIRRESRGDRRFLCLKVLSDIVLLVLQSGNVYQPKLEDSKRTRHINEFIVRMLLPLFGSILDDESPTPLYGMKLLRVIVESNPAFLTVVCHHKLVPKIFSFFEADHPNYSMNVAKLVLAMVGSSEVDRMSLYEHSVSKRVSSVLRSAYEHDTDESYEPCLATTSSLLYQTSQAVLRARRGSASSSTSSVDVERHAHFMLRENKVLVGNMDVYLTLLSSDDVSISEQTSLCIQLCAQVYPSCHSILVESTGLRCLRQAILNEDVQKGSGQAVIRRILRAVFYIGSGDNDHAQALCQEDGLWGAIEDLALWGTGAVKELAGQVSHAVRSNSG